MLGVMCVAILPEGLAGIVRGADPAHERVAMLGHKVRRRHADQKWLCERLSQLCCAFSVIPFMGQTCLCLQGFCSVAIQAGTGESGSAGTLRYQMPTGCFSCRGASAECHAEENWHDVACPTDPRLLQQVKYLY